MTTLNLEELERLLEELESANQAFSCSGAHDRAEKLSASFTAKLRLSTAAVNALPELIRRMREAEEDSRRFVFYVGDHPKSPNFMNKFLQGCRDHWTIDQWRTACDEELSKGQTK